MTRRVSKPDFASVRETIRTGMLEEAVPGMAVAVARDGEILWEEGFGWADRERRIEATPHTLFSLASISKPITATAVMILKERGKLDVDKPANDYLGDAKITARVGDAQDITTRQLANHTSGMTTHFQFFYEDEPYQRPPMDETIRRYAIAVKPPGERHDYCNLGYGILDYLVSRHSGMSFAEFLRREVFLPLGMVRSSLDIAPGLEPFTAARYGSDGVPYPFYDFDHPGGSAVYCSAHDLLRFGLFHLETPLLDQKPVLTSESLADMKVSTIPGDGSTGYGFGWATNADDHGTRNFSHGGGMGGVSTSLVLFPEEKIAIVSLANRSCGLAYRLGEEIAAAMMPEYRKRFLEAKQKEESEREKPSTPDPEFKTPRSLLGEWQGTIHTYEQELPFKLWFQRDGDIHAQVGDGLKALVNRARWNSSRLGGVFLGDLRTPDVERRPYELRLDLQLRGRSLNGAIKAVTRLPHGEGGAPGKRGGNCLPHWAELRRARRRA